MKALIAAILLSVAVPSAQAQWGVDQDGYRVYPPPPPPKPRPTKYVCGYYVGYTLHSSRFRVVFGDESHSSVTLGGVPLTEARDGSWTDSNGYIYEISTWLGDDSLLVEIKYPATMTKAIYHCSVVSFWNF